VIDFLRFAPDSALSGGRQGLGLIPAAIRYGFKTFLASYGWGNLEAYPWLYWLWAIGAALAAGEVDLAIGADQRGSGRIPAAWCGVTAIKATHGLVPSFGVIGMDHTVDHVCPMARSVAETALALEVIAGDDPRDPQWVRGPIRTDRYTEAVGRDVKGIRIGLLGEAFDWSVSDPEVNESVKGAVQGLGKQGAIVKELSLPPVKIHCSVLAEDAIKAARTETMTCQHIYAVGSMVADGRFNSCAHDAYTELTTAGANIDAMTFDEWWNGDYLTNLRGQHNTGKFINPCLSCREKDTWLG
jgi:Asp-tRNA(Asn)/Glu-tRNA(Gln) amidotransferase A subunit family amidase